MRVVWGIVALLLVIGITPASADSTDGCNNLITSQCPGTARADQVRGDFHGLIMVPGQPGVLDTAAHSGTRPGCGDCEWTLIVACLRNDPNQADDQGGCTGAAESAHCTRGQLLYRLFLTTDAARNQLVDTLCLGGPSDVVPVGEQAALDVQRYLKDVTPPNLDLHVSPPKGVPAGMPAYFWVRAPQFDPVPFGNGQITETITIKPARYDWTWGDGNASGWTTDAGAPYPNGTLTHIYDVSGTYAGHVVTEWGGTYTITVAGQTFGPYDAIGTVTKRQPFSTTVLEAHSTLVSH